MSAAWPDPAHVCAGSGEPILDALTHRAIGHLPGATADEIAEEVIHVETMLGRNSISSYYRRMITKRVREIVYETWRTPKPTLDEIKAERAELEKAGRPSGQRALAEALHTSKTDIQRTLAREKKR